jgi:hypothetical protein
MYVRSSVIEERIVFLLGKQYDSILLKFLCLLDIWTIAWLCKKNSTIKAYIQQYKIHTNFMISDSRYFLSCADSKLIPEDIHRGDLDVYIRSFKEHIIRTVNVDKNMEFFMFTSKFPQDCVDHLGMIATRQKLCQIENKGIVTMSKYRISEDETRFLRITFTKGKTIFSDDQVLLIPDGESDGNVQLTSMEDSLFVTGILYDWKLSTHSIIATNGIKVSSIVDGLNSVNSRSQYVSCINQFYQIAYFGAKDIKMEESISVVKKQIKDDLMTRKVPINMTMCFYSIPILSLIISSVTPEIYEARWKRISQFVDLDPISCRKYTEDSHTTISTYAFPIRTFPNHVVIHKNLEEEFYPSFLAHLEQQHKQQQ